jgi:hypothetical protein
MPDETRLASFLEKISAAQDTDELANIAAEIEQTDLDEVALTQLTDALREARERLS